IFAVCISLLCALFVQAQQPGSPRPLARRDAGKRAFMPATVGSISENALQWRRSLASPVVYSTEPSFVLSADGFLVMQGTSEAIVGIRATDGTTVFQTSGPAASSNIMIGAGGPIFFVDHASYFHAVNAYGRPLYSVSVNT